MPTPTTEESIVAIEEARKKAIKKLEPIHEIIAAYDIVLDILKEDKIEKHHTSSSASGKE